MSARAELPVVPGQCYKFLVASAEEAVSLIRERLGENARVLSVRQVEGEGLSRFLRAPRLQVIATVPENSAGTVSPQQKTAPAANPEASEVAPQSASSAAVSKAVPTKTPEVAQSTQPEPVTPPRGSRSGVERTSISSPSDEPAFSGEVVRSRVPTAGGVLSGRLWPILERAGLPKEFLRQLQQREEWRELDGQPLSSALGQSAHLLRHAAPVRKASLGRRVVFFGTPGAGATTALCKQLALDVFLRQRSACVLKLDTDDPNPTEGLATFCEALGVHLLRTPGELVDVPSDCTVYFDVPGTPLSGPAARRLRQIFDEQKIDSRVLVVNAAYDREVIQHAYTQAVALHAGHVVFTHVDELPRYGKLWEFVLDQNVAPLFACTGRNLAGDCETNVLELLVERTLSVSCA